MEEKNKPADNTPTVDIHSFRIDRTTDGMQRSRASEPVARVAIGKPGTRVDPQLLAQRMEAKRSR